MAKIGDKSICQRCGAEFSLMNGCQRYCGKECSKEMSRIKHKMWQRNNYGKPKSEMQETKVMKNKAIRDINAEAMKAGMSYGKYVAMMGL
jgi:predicted amidophosphoribosyltransferase